MPGWYGTGAAFDDILGAEPDRLDDFRRLYRTWPFFRAVVSNAQREMGRARLVIAAEYAARGEAAEGDADDPPDFHARIVHDYDRARTHLLAVAEAEEIMDDAPVIRKSIALRNPYTDVLNLLQLELLRRSEAGSGADSGGDSDDVDEAIFLTINGVAAAMQSTG